MEDLTGRMFGEYTVIKFAYPKGRHYYWECLCSCGETSEVRMDKLKSDVSNRCRKCKKRSKAKATVGGEWNRPKEEIIKQLALIGWEYCAGVYVSSTSRFDVKCIKCQFEKNLLWEHRHRNPCRKCGVVVTQDLVLKEEPWSSRFKDCPKVRREFSVWQGEVKVASGCVFLNEGKKGVEYKVNPPSYTEIVVEMMT